MSHVRCVTCSMIPKVEAARREVHHSVGLGALELAAAGEIIDGSCRSPSSDVTVLVGASHTT